VDIDISIHAALAEKNRKQGDSAPRSLCLRWGAARQ